MHYLPDHLSPLARQMLQGLAAAPNREEYPEDCQVVREHVRNDAMRVHEIWRQRGVVFSTEAVTLEGVPCLWIHPPEVCQQDQDGQQDGLLLYTHGGGFISGSADTFLGLAHQVATASRRSVLSIDYRLAPEHPFPAALDDSVAVYRGLLDKGYRPSDIGWFGESAGGGLVLATVHALRREDLPPPAAVALISPWVDLSVSGETAHTLSRVDPFLSPSMLETWSRAYAGQHSLQDPRISPLQGRFADFPPLLIQAGTKEILLSDSLRLARRARRDGVSVDLDVWDGMWHVFQATPGLPEATDAIAEIGRFFSRHLSPDERTPEE